MDSSNRIPPALSKPSSVSHYRILDKLGEGGCAIVYRALDTKLQREVALKFLPFGEADDARSARLIREACSAASLTHPNICVVYEVAEVEGSHFIAMELIDGEDLRERLARAPMPLNDALRIGAEIAEALAAAHAKEVVHRDIKPANVMLTRDGRVKVMDFGLAQKTGSTRITATGARMGTPAYMSPEQAVGEPAGPATDVWSLGVTIYEMVTGELPFKGEVPVTLAYSLINEDHPPLGDLRPGIPDELEDLIDVMLAKRAEDRADMVEVAKRLRALHNSLDDLAGRQPERTVERTSPRAPALLPSRSGLRRGLRRRRLNSPWVLAAAVTATLAFGAAVLTFGTDRRHTADPTGGETRANITVLPISTLGGDEDLQAFSDGLMEAITQRLSEFERDNKQLVVVSPSEVRRQEVHTPADALAKFGAGYAVESSLQGEGESVRLVLTVVDTATGRQIETTTVDGKRTAALTLQDQGITKLAVLLDLSTSGAHVDDSARLRPQAPGAYEFYVTGRGYLQRNDRLQNIDSAIDVFQRAIETDPKYALAYSGLCEAFWFRYQRTNETEWVPKARETCNRALELDEQAPEVHITMGALQRGTGEYGMALLSFQRALELDPRNADAIGGLASAYEALRQPQKAEATYRQAIGLRPSDWNAYKQLGLFYYRHGEYQKAIEQYQEVVRLTPDNAHGYTNLGVFYSRIGDEAQAQAMLERAVELEPRPTALSNLGSLLSRRGLLSEAAQKYEQAIALRPNDPHLHANLASLAGRTGDAAKRKAEYQEAIRLVTASLDVDPMDAGLLAQRAHYWATLGDLPKAEGDLDQAARLSPESPSTIALLAETASQVGREEQAIALLNKAFNLGFSLDSIAPEWSLFRLIEQPAHRSQLERLTGSETGER